MSKKDFEYKQATNLSQIDNNINERIILDRNHPFFVPELEESQKISDFKENFLNTIGYSKAGFTPIQNTQIYIFGFRGVGKTTVFKNLTLDVNESKNYLVIYCDLFDSKELDLNDLDFVDLTIFQLKVLLSYLNDKLWQEKKFLEIIKTSHLGSRLKDLYEYSKEVEVEISSKTQKKAEIDIKAEAGVEAGFNISLIPSIKLLSKLLGNLSLSKTNAKVIRQKINSSMSEYLAKYNDLIFEIEKIVKKAGFGESILFLVDGVEKMPKESDARELFVENKQLFEKLEFGIYVYALPIPLRKERGNPNFVNNKMLNFPFYRITNPDIFEMFKKVLEKRIKLDLFTEKALDLCINFSGGSIRQMFQIIRYAVGYASKTQLDEEAVNKAIVYLSNLKYDIMSEEMYDKLELVVRKMYSKFDEKNRPIKITDDDCLQRMLEYQILFDYNDGTKYEPNPLLKVRDYYKVMEEQILAKKEKQNAH